ncbi:MAG: hypothetical protein GXY07_17615 [Candidatus Hydrogenedentes bacterium]|nr:hypothetical protein [Candidatus Hydrogenedentota bacterium]
MLKKQRGTISIVALIAGGLLCVFCVPTLAQPIEIDSIEELQKIGNDPGYPLSGDYILTQDIDASVTKTWDDGAGFAPIGPESTDSFIGHFDGQGHAIVNVHINRPYKSFNVGLFGYVGAGGIVENLGIEDIHVSGRSVVGGGVGFNKGTLNNL